MLHTVIGITYGMAQNPVFIPEASHLITLEVWKLVLRQICTNKLAWCLLKGSTSWLFINILFCVLLVG